MFMIPDAKLCSVWLIYYVMWYLIENFEYDPGPKNKESSFQLFMIFKMTQIFCTMTGSSAVGFAVSRLW